MSTSTKAKPNTEMASWSQFEGEIRSRDAEIATLLPSHISKEKFVNTAIIAAKNNPDLILCDRRSLHAAITKAAEDGLQPDGREGVINVYKEKRVVGGKDVWLKVACWIPMTFGIRKRARELCGMIIDAQIVHANDDFDWHQGDNPHIDHKPTPLAEEPGDRIGVYAIFKQGDMILHREVMRKKQVLDVKSVVKAQNGLLWTKFEDEAWRKTALRRGIKTVPSVPDALTRIISRDDDQYDIDATPQRTAIAPAAHFEIPEEPAAPAPVIAAQPEQKPPIQTEAPKQEVLEDIPDDDGWPGPQPQSK